MPRNSINDARSNLSGGQSDSLSRALSSYRGLSGAFYASSKRITQEVMKDVCYSNICYYPCNLIDLRYILGSENIYNSHVIALFSINLAKKYLQSEYPILVGIEIKKGDCDDFGGIMIPKTCSSLQVNDKIRKVILREDFARSCSPKIQKIVEECGMKIEVGQDTDLPTLRSSFD